MGEIPVLSFSSIRDWKTCRQLWHYRRVQKLRKKVKSLALKRGDWIHRALEAYYKDPMFGTEKVFKELDAEWEELTEEEKDYYGDLPSEVRRIVTGYFKKYEGQPLGSTIATELVFGMEGQAPIELLPNVLLRGKIDRLFEDKTKYGGLWVEEHKTTARRWPTDGFRLYDLQTAIYVKVVQLMGFPKPRGVVFDYIRTKPPSIPRVLKNGELSRARRTLSATDYDTYLAALIENGLDPEEYAAELEATKENIYYERKYLPKPDSIVDTLLQELRIVSLEIQKLSHYPIRNLRRECEQYCEFYPLCSAELLGLDAAFVKEYEYVVKAEDEEEEVEDDNNEENTEEEH